jgi:hypothetical protein
VKEKRNGSAAGNNENGGGINNGAAKAAIWRRKAQRKMTAAGSSVAASGISANNGKWRRIAALARWRHQQRHEASANKGVMSVWRRKHGSGVFYQAIAAWRQRM